MHKKPDTNGVIITLVFMAGLGAAAQFGKIAVALSEFRAIYDVSEVALGFLISSVGTVGLIFGVIGGALLSRIGIRRAIVWGLGAAGLLSAVQATLPSFPVMIGLRLLEGTSHLAIVIAGPILMARHSSDRARPAVLTLWSAFFGLSYMLMAMAAPLLITALGLPGYMLAHGGYMLVLAAALHLTLTPPPVPATPAVHIALSPRALPALQWRIYRSPWLSAAALAFGCYTILYIALLAYLPEFAVPRHSDGMAALMPFVSIITSLTLGVWILSRITSVRAVQVGFVLTGVLALALVPTSGTASFALVAVILMGATGLIPGASFAALADLTETDEDRALAMGALAQMGNVGTTSGPPLMAAIISGAGLSGATIMILVFCALGVGIHAVLARRRAAQPIRR